MVTRICARCRAEKTIRGVWYLTPHAARSASFVCEQCYSTLAAVPAA